jgi:malonyl-CoA O-methyltransferase
MADAPESAPPLEVPTAAGYDRWAEIYDGEDNPLIALEELHIGPLIGEVRGLSVIDVGAGTGRHALRLAAAGAKVTALDFSEGMLRQLLAKPGADAITLLRHDLSGRSGPLPCAERSFDRALCCLMLDHIADVTALMSELRRLLRPGGFVVVSVMHPAMMLRGVQARFSDPATGRKTCPQSHPNTISDYVMGAVRAGLTLAEMSEHAVSPALCRVAPRAERYLGWPMLLLMKLVRAS